MVRHTSVKMHNIDVFLVIAYSVIVPLNLMGNILVFLVVRFNRSMKTPMNFLLVNLAVADMVVAIFLLPSNVFFHLFNHPNGKAGDYLCKFLTAGNVMWIGGNASGSTLVAIALERYFAILLPYSTHAKKAKKKVNSIILSCWLFGVIANIPLFVVTVYDKDSNTCRESWKKDNILAKLYPFVWFLCGVGAPLLIMIVLYAKIGRRLWAKETRSTQAPQIAILLYRKHVTKILLLVTIAYGVFWLPNPLVYIMVYNSPYLKYGSSLYRVTILLSCLGSSLNPFIYSLNSEKFRKHSKDIICCFRNRRRVTTLEEVIRRSPIPMIHYVNKMQTECTETLDVTNLRINKFL